ncbi:MAG: ferrochelatase [Actinobacteria bacterium]|nr:ferrochelatase [Actinomycetota bacterium]MCL5888211.1 ferrochelatase [Actinomycetota bacterium]
MIGWLAMVLFGGLLSGLAMVGFMVLKKAAEPLMVSLWVLGAVLAGWGIFQLAAYPPRTEVLVVTAMIGVAAFIGGYGLGSAILTTIGTRSFQATRVPVWPASSADPRTAALLIAAVDAVEYEPEVVHEELERWGSLVSSRIGLLVTPLLYATHKARYRTLGGESPGYAQAKALVENVEAILRRESEIDTVVMATCTRTQSPDKVIAGLAKEGVSRFVVSGLSVGESYSIDQAKSQIDQMDLPSEGVQVAYTPSLFGVDRLASVIADRILSRMPTQDGLGVALLMSGQPEHHRRTHEIFDIQEATFCSRIRLLLTEAGLASEFVRVCSLEWRDPDLTETVRHLAAYGCENILVAPVCMPFDTLSARIDIQLAIRRARVADTSAVHVLNSWGTEPEVPKIIAETIVDAHTKLVRVTASANGDH